MAARTNKVRHQEDIRQKIKGSQLVNFLQDHALDDKPASKSRVSAALGLLKKIVPDMQAIEGTMQVTVTHEDALRELDDDPATE